MFGVDSFTRLYNAPFINACTQESPQAGQPAAIKIGMRGHQRAILQSMNDLEGKLSAGYTINGESLYSRFAILGDSVGVGKSLMVLGHIAINKGTEPLTKYKSLNPYSNRNVFSLITNEFTDISNSAALLVVPHILFHQWEDYIATQTTLKPLLVKSMRTLGSKNFHKNVTEADLVLVSNTLLGKFLQETEKTIWFSRVYIDEADTIHIPSTQPFPRSTFVWFVTATWQNLIFENERTWYSHANIERIAASADFLTYDPSFQAQIVNSLVGMRGLFMRYACRSGTYLKEFVRIHHPYRTHLVLRCRDEFIAESISLPPLFTSIIHCQPSLAQRIVASAITSQVQNLLNAGDIQSALTSLGVASDSPMNLIQAVTENRITELKRLKRLYDFKSAEEYSTPQAKEQALMNLKGKIVSLEEQIQAIKSRIENYKKEICAICYDEPPQQALLTPCCSRVFCAACILTSLSKIVGCPLCRTLIEPSKLISFEEKPLNKKKATVIEKGPPKKIDALMNLIVDHPNDKFLVFSRYENPFQLMQERLLEKKISVQTVKGSKDVVNNLLTRFDEGDVRVLLLNAAHAGSGLNITAATYVVLWHAMTVEEEKQILGRAYRMGRSKPLNFVKLVHPEEVRN